jgi:hypothetical protein
MRAPDPKHSVEVVRADKRADYLHVEGVAEGRKVAVDVPVPSLETFKTERDKEAYLRRALLGVKRMDDKDKR